MATSAPPVGTTVAIPEMAARAAVEHPSLDVTLPELRATVGGGPQRVVERPSLDVTLPESYAPPQSVPVPLSAADAESEVFSAAIGTSREPAFLGNDGLPLRIGGNGARTARLGVSFAVIATAILGGIEKLGWATITTAMGEFAKRLLHC
jgi:hypothetical protein